MSRTMFACLDIEIDYDVYYYYQTTRAKDTFKYRMHDGPRRSNMNERAKKRNTKRLHYERKSKNND